MEYNSTNSPYVQPWGGVRECNSAVDCAIKQGNSTIRLPNAACRVGFDTSRGNICICSVPAGRTGLRCTNLSQPNESVSIALVVLTTPLLFLGIYYASIIVIRKGRKLKAGAMSCFIVAVVGECSSITWLICKTYLTFGTNRQILKKMVPIITTFALPTLNICAMLSVFFVAITWIEILTSVGRVFGALFQSCPSVTNLKILVTCVSLVYFGLIVLLAYARRYDFLAFIIVPFACVTCVCYMYVGAKLSKLVKSMSSTSDNFQGVARSITKSIHWVCISVTMLIINTILVSVSRIMSVNPDPSIIHLEQVSSPLNLVFLTIMCVTVTQYIAEGTQPKKTNTSQTTASQKVHNSSRFKKFSRRWSSSRKSSGVESIDELDRI